MNKHNAVKVVFYDQRLILVTFESHVTKLELNVTTIITCSVTNSRLKTSSHENKVKRIHFKHV